MINETTKKNFKRAFKSLFGYPVVIFISWGPFCATDFIAYYDANVEISSRITLMTATLGASMGLLSSIVFWTTDHTVAKYWNALGHSGYNLDKFRRSGRGRCQSKGGGGSTPGSTDMNGATSDSTGVATVASSTGITPISDSGEPAGFGEEGSKASRSSLVSKVGSPGKAKRSASASVSSRKVLTTQ